MTYHYAESGLDNIYLQNGFARHATPYGEGVSIEDAAGLHRAIGRWLVDRPTLLNGAELRFLRLEMELTQRDLAGILGATEQTLRLWEKGRTKGINAIADRLVRLVFADWADERGGPDVGDMLRRLADLDCAKRGKTCFRRTRQAWQHHRANGRPNPAAEQLSA